MAEDGLRIRVEYCVECSYAQRATWMVGELLTEIADSIAAVEIVPGHLGAFEWAVNGQPVYSKHDTGRFPELEELKLAIYAHLD